MIPAGFARALRSFARRRPFQPFLIEFHSGDRLPINHPEAATIRGDLIIYVSPTYQHRLFDSTSVSQLLDIPSQAPAEGS